MPPTSPDRVVLTDTQRGHLDRLVRAGRTEQRLALRAGIVLRSASASQPSNPIQPGRETVQVEVHYQPTSWTDSTTTDR